MEDSLSLHANGIQKLFHRLAQANRVLVGRGGGFTFAQSHFLIELDAVPTRNMRDLEALLHIGQSSISRLAQGLETKGLIAKTPSAHDSRRYHLKILARGYRAIASIDKAADHRLNKFCSNLNKLELNRIKVYFDKLADNIDEPSSIARPNEHPLRLGQRRLARAFGLLGDSYLGSGMPLSHWHTLAEVCLEGEVHQVKVLSQRLALAPNSVSTILTKLKNLKLIRISRSLNDGRTSAITATSKGTELFNDLVKKTVELIKLGTRSLSEEEICDFHKLLRKFVLAANTNAQKLFSSLDISIISEADSLANARAFIITQGLKAEDAKFIPSKLLSPESKVVECRNDEGIQAVFQFELSPKKEFIITAAGWRFASIKGEVLEELINLATNKAIGTDIVAISYHPLSKAIQAN